MSNFICQSPVQALSHPWLGLLLSEGETRVNYSRCAATLVGDNFYSISILFTDKKHSTTTLVGENFYSLFILFTDWKHCTGTLVG